MDYPFLIARVQPPPSPKKKIGEGVSVGEGASVHRLVSDQTDNPFLALV